MRVYPIRQLLGICFIEMSRSTKVKDFMYILMKEILIMTRNNNYILFCNHYHLTCTRGHPTLQAALNDTNLRSYSIWYLKRKFIILNSPHLVQFIPYSIAVGWSLCLRKSLACFKNSYGSDCTLPCTLGGHCVGLSNSQCCEYYKLC